MANVLQSRPSFIKHAQSFVKSGAAEKSAHQLLKKNEDESEVSLAWLLTITLRHSFKESVLLLIDMFSNTHRVHLLTSNITSQLF